MSSANIFENLPEDPYEALQEAYYRALVDAFGVAVFDDDNLEGANDYIQNMYGFGAAYGDLLSADIRLRLTGLTPAADYREARDQNSRIRGAVNSAQAMAARKTRDGGFTSLQLTRTAKAEIRGLVEEIKIKLDGIHLKIEQRDSLVKKLNAFEVELDRERTGLSSFLAAMIQVSSASGEAAEELEPVVSKFERIMRALGLGAEDTPQLPKWEERKRLPAPDNEDNPKTESDSE